MNVEGMNAVPKWTIERTGLSLYGNTGGCMPDVGI
jgi:hypothetical protein